MSRSIANSRLRDFYDLHILIELRGHSIDAKTLTQAVKATTKRRGTAGLLPDAATIFEEIFTNESLSNSWEKYRREYSYAEDISWDNVKHSVFNLWDMTK